MGKVEAKLICGGLTTKIVAHVDALGTLARFVLLPGQRHNCIAADGLIDGLEMEMLLADKGFDNNRLRALPQTTGVQAVHSAESQPKDFGPLLLRNLPMASSHREFLLRSQTVQWYRDAIRQNRHKFPGLHLPARNALDHQMNVNGR